MALKRGDAVARIESSGNEPRLLLVEGPNDKHVVWQICNRHPALPDFYIHDRNGVNAVLDSIGSELIVPGRQALGILVDSDDSLQSRWDEITYQLRDEGITPPSSPSLDGTIIDDGNPRVGVWLMPNNQAPGELEDFVSQMIPDGDPVWPLAQQYIAGIPPFARKFAAGKTLRAQLHSWLAAREDPRQIGLAIRARDLAIDGELCQKFVAWLTRLFA